MFFKPKKSIGVDLGSHSVKVVQMERAGRRFTAEKAALVPVNHEQFLQDQTAALTAALSKALAGLETKKALIVAALASQDAIIRYLQLPDMPAEELRGSVELEADQNIPFDLADVVLDSTPLEKIMEKDENLVRVLMVAARREILQRHLDVLSGAGITPDVVGVTTLALADASDVNERFREGETVALINLGATATHIHFCKDGKSNFTRDIGRGGRELTEAIQRHLRVNFDEAERIKIAFGQAQQEVEDAGEAVPQSEEEIWESEEAEVPDEGDEVDQASAKAKDEVLEKIEHSVAKASREEVSAQAEAEPEQREQIVRATGPIIDRLIDEIRRSIDFYEENLFEKPVERIILSGGSAAFAGLDQSISSSLNVPLEIADPLKNIDYNQSNMNIRDLIEHRPQFTIAVGLAARGVEGL